MGVLKNYRLLRKKRAILTVLFLSLASSNGNYPAPHFSRYYFLPPSDISLIFNLCCMSMYISNLNVTVQDAAFDNV